ncbi:MAG: tetratricopeptide repeat protein [Raineya sp.]|nr:tetratricopeptide repeat protein [Raineya sp.]
MFKSGIFVGGIFFCYFFSLAQSPKDSLIRLLNQNPPDSIAYNIFLQLGNQFQQINPDSALHFHQKAIDKAILLKDTFRIVQAMNLQIIDNYIATRHENGKKIAENLLKIIRNSSKTKPILKIEASTYNLLGLIEKEVSNFAIAIEYFFKALKINEQIADMQGQSNNFGNIGHVYFEQKDFNKASKYYQKALEIAEKYELANVTNHLISLGNVEMSLKKYETAEKYFFRALDILEKREDFYTMGACYNSIAENYESQNKLYQALEYYQKSLKIAQDIENQYAVMINLNSIGGIYLKLQNYPLAEYFLTRSLKIAKEISALENERDIQENLAQLYEKTQRPYLALQALQRHLHLKDSLSQTENIKAFLQKELQYNYEKQKLADSLKNAQEITIKNSEIARQQAEIRAKKNEQIALFGGLFSALLLAGVLYNRFRITNRQKRIIEKQKQEVETQKNIVELQKAEIEHKNQSILDSIRYAQRIQNALLPNDKEWQQVFPNSFILYQPRDIVAGDFYWLEVWNNKVFFAVADCTGHGVPGAMVSMVCSSALTKIILEENLTEPHCILERAKKIITETFAKHSEREVKDGMEVALCSFSLENPHCLAFCGAQRPLWILRNGEVIEFEGDKMPVAQFNYSERFNFNQHFIDLCKNDRIFIFSDGFTDQFGGEKNKKIGSKNFRNWLKESASLPIQEQGKWLNEKLQSWKKNEPQTDDITLIGIEIT